PGRRGRARDQCQDRHEQAVAGEEVRQREAEARERGGGDRELRPPAAGEKDDEARQQADLRHREPLDGPTEAGVVRAQERGEHAHEDRGDRARPEREARNAAGDHGEQADEGLEPVHEPQRGGARRDLRRLDDHRAADEDEEEDGGQIESGGEQAIRLGAVGVAQRRLLRLRAAGRGRVRGTAHEAILPALPPGFSAAVPRGRVTVKQEPTPGVLATVIWPSRRSTSRCTMWSPSPTPPKRRVGEASTWRNISKITGRSAAAMPMPVSLTSMTSRSPAALARTSTLPWSVNLSALPTRFFRIVFTFTRSLRTWRAAGGTSQRNATPGCTMASSSRSSSSERACRSRGAGSMASRPASRRPRSRVAFTSSRRSKALRRTRPSVSCWSGVRGPNAPSASRSA